MLFTSNCFILFYLFFVTGCQGMCIARYPIQRYLFPGLRPHESLDGWWEWLQFTTLIASLRRHCRNSCRFTRYTSWRHQNPTSGKRAKCQLESDGWMSLEKRKLAHLFAYPVKIDFLFLFCPPPLPEKKEMHVIWSRVRGGGTVSSPLFSPLVSSI